MEREQALEVVKAQYPKIKAGNWFVAANSLDWEVWHLYAGRRQRTVEVFVLPDGSMETVDGKKI